MNVNFFSRRDELIYLFPNQMKGLLLLFLFYSLNTFTFEKSCFLTEININ